MQLTPGESHEKLRRVDSNRKSRSFNKQPSTGDYYKTLGNDTAEPRGSGVMAPNEEVSQVSAVESASSSLLSKLRLTFLFQGTNPYVL